MSLARLAAVMPLDGELTQLLDDWSGGDPEALERIMPLVLNDLRHVAAKYLSRESGGHTLQPTALVNELYLRLAGRRTVQWKNREQFFAFSAELMRRILVEHARHKKALRHGGGAPKITFDETLGPSFHKDLDVLALVDALDALAKLDARQCRIVELRYFIGLTIAETAELLKVAPATVKRDWAMARRWLYRELARE